ncbi:hypothetical protein PU560_11500 [Georgenia sp. 10Sc9-8]|uniref:Uncharacterized protein n=1 Tax=Georgenia halotolerans TaxID=3028317 RepID=A0ABT5TYC8_9MICO|nr:hypothetical protein [Georgenia halotolerans]
MARYASWTRIEPDHRATDPRPGARAPVADPFWLLGRQWWIGELDGFDGGAPVASEVELTTTAVGDAPDARHTVLSAELAAPVPEPDERGPGDWRTAHRLGRSAAAHLHVTVQRLRQQVDSGATEPEELRRVQEAADRLAEDFPLDVPGVLAHRIPTDQRVDGVELLAACRTGDRRVAELADHLTAWADRHAHVRLGADTFTVENGRHTVALPAGRGELRSEDSRGPDLHWSELTARPGDLSVTGTQDPVPVRLTFEGAPPVRWWGVEDPEVDVVAAPAGPSDLGRLLMSAMLQEQGGVCWALPVDVPAGSLLRVVGVTLRDGFGNTRSSAPLEDGDLRGWKLGHHSELDPDPATDWMLMLNEPDPLRGAAVEEVALLADEADNLLWMVEDIATDPWGRGYHVPQGAPRPAPDREEYTPRLIPPDAWLAYQQTAPDRLDRAVLAPLGGRATPRTRFARDHLDMTPAMLGGGGGGRRLRRQWSLARSVSGRRLLWETRRSLADLPRGGPGLLHDQVVGPEA